MAFDLPRGPRSLRFTGEVRSLAANEEAAPPSLGRQRPRPPSSSGVDTPTRTKLDIPSLVPEEDDDDDRETLCMVDVALLPDARIVRPNVVDSTGPHEPQLPVPGFRSRDDVLRQHHEAMNASRQAPSGGPFSLGVWLIASLVLAVVSFFVAPVVTRPTPSTTATRLER